MERFEREEISVSQVDYWPSMLTYKSENNYKHWMIYSQLLVDRRSEG
jgi:hypothetical protein